MDQVTMLTEGEAGDPDQLPLPGIGSTYAVKLDIFEGPLDLLLHLIRGNELDVTAVSIAAVGEQYLQYLELMKDVNIDAAGDYLVMAATLALIKSRMLLPPDSSTDEDEGPDPAAALIERLLEYKRFKEAAEQLGERDRLGREVFAVQGPPPETTPESERELEVGIYELVKAYRELLERSKDTAQVHTFEMEPVTVHERMNCVMQMLEAREAVEFNEIFEVEGQVGSKPMIVATFIAMLELTKIRAIRIFQSFDEEGTPNGPIRLRMREGNEGQNWAQRIAEIM